MVTPVIIDTIIGGLCIGALIRMNSGMAMMTIYKVSLCLCYGLDSDGIM